MNKKLLALFCAILFFCFASSLHVKADGDVPISGNQCNPNIQECPPPCVPGLSCPGDGGSSRAAVSVTPKVGDSKPADQSKFEEFFASLKGFFGF